MPYNDAPAVTVTINSRGWVKCPYCGILFKPTNASSWNGERHRKCGQRLQMQFSAV
jgi:hypothetical protein